MAEDIPLAVRRVVYARDAHKCRWCGRANGVSLHLHHIVYRSGGGRHVPENLITLCYEHHSLVHSDKGEHQPVLLELVDREPHVTAFQLLRWKQTEPPPALRPSDTQTDVQLNRETGPVGRLFAGDEPAV